jgi:metal-responsive CopG/Arc/MetJ family transcriptional regulator
MRTTITLDKDVAARLDRLRKTRPFKDLVKDALRVGLDKIENQYSITPVRAVRAAQISTRSRASSRMWRRNASGRSLSRRKSAVLVLHRFYRE